MHPAAGQMPHRQEEQQDRPGDGRVAPLQGTLQSRPIDHRGEALERASEEALESLPAARKGATPLRFRRLVTAGEVGGQDQLRLDQREDQADGHDLARIEKTCPIGPGTISIGMKAATVVSTPKITGMATSWVPLMAPSRRFPVRC